MNKQMNACMHEWMDKCVGWMNEAIEEQDLVRELQVGLVGE